MIFFIFFGQKSNLQQSRFQEINQTFLKQTTGLKIRTNTMTTSFTTILPQNPGYYLRLFPDSTYQLEWAPVSSHYSPPSLHPGIWKHQVPVDDKLEKGLIIGKQGRHLKRITEKTNCHYIFLKQDSIEIWGSQASVLQAEQQLKKHLDYLLRQAIYCPHESMADICQHCKDCSMCSQKAHCYGCKTCATCNPQPNGYCKGCGECKSCAPIFYDDMCESCYEHAEWEKYFKEEDDYQRKQNNKFDYTEHFRATHAPAFTYHEAELLLQRGPPSDYICCTDNCDESEMCRCCAGVCNH